jgi:hypothetical protein
MWPIRERQLYTRIDCLAQLIGFKFAAPPLAVSHGLCHSLSTRPQQRIILGIFGFAA